MTKKKQTQVTLRLIGQRIDSLKQLIRQTSRYDDLNMKSLLTRAFEAELAEIIALKKELEGK